MKDEQGDSDVTEWNLGENVLTFKKKYSHMNHAVSYRLEKITPTVYFGKWEYGDAGIVVAEGEARLILTAIPEGFTELATLFDEVR